MNIHSPSLTGDLAACPPRLPVCVAIPVKNEEAHIALCLKALARATRRGRTLVHVRNVILLLNNCTDRSKAVITALAPRLPFPVAIIEVALPPGRAHAGAARRMAADNAARSLELRGEQGAILVTDADSRVAPNWLTAHAAAFARGVDAVAGAVWTDPIDFAGWPAHLRRRELTEARYSRLISQITHLVDPDPLDPWPRHDQASGASLGVLLHAYRQTGGIPELAVGEDRAFVSLLKACGLRVRHDPNVRVITSGRFFGRAAGGAADTIRNRSSDGGAPCDVRLEPVADAFRRLRLRRLLRYKHSKLKTGDEGRVSFAEYWQDFEAARPRLRPIPIAPGGLAGELEKARLLLRALASRSTPDVNTVT